MKRRSGRPNGFGGLLRKRIQFFSGPVQKVDGADAKSHDAQDQAGQHRRGADIGQKERDQSDGSCAGDPEDDAEKAVEIAFHRFRFGHPVQLRMSCVQHHADGCGTDAQEQRQDQTGQNAGQRVSRCESRNIGRSAELKKNRNIKEPAGRNEPRASGQTGKMLQGQTIKRRNHNG